MRSAVFYKTKEEIDLIRASCLLVCKALAHIGSIIKPGITGEFIDKEAEALIRDNKAKPGFKGYNGFPGTLCISPNDGVVHGIPTKYEFKENDIISVDCGVFMNGFFGDSAFTFALNGTDEKSLKLMQVTDECLYKGIEMAVAGRRVGDISYAIQMHAEKKHGYGVVRELVGHGIGRNLHEGPEVPNFGSRGRGPVLKEGLVIAIEPMINQGTKNVKQSNDGWTIITKDGLNSAHFEHTVAIGKEKADILSNHDFVKEVVKNNPYLQDF